MAPKQTSSERTEIHVLFPEETVDLPDGSVVTVRPLSLEQLPKVMDAFGTIMKKAEVRTSDSEVATVALAELLKLLPYCIDKEPSDIPGDIVPDILEIVLKQNVTDAAISKWTALIGRVGQFGGSVQGGKKASKKS